MAAINVDKMSLKELVALNRIIQNAIAEARTRERAELKSKFAELALSHGFSISDLFGGKGAAKTKSVAKYANPDDSSDTWTGRGRKPNWLVARLKKGAKLSEFEI